MKINKTFKLSLAIIFGVINFTTFTRPASALGEYWPGGFSSGVIRWLADSSVSGSYLNTYIAPAANNWNGKSSKVSLSRVTTGSYIIKALVAQGTDPYTFGLMTPYCTAGTYDACGSLTWNSGTVIGYENAMVFNSFTTTQRIKSFTHEFGHALSLKHVINGSSAVMAQGQSNLGVQLYDRANLQAKWGK